MTHPQVDDLGEPRVHVSPAIRAALRVDRPDVLGVDLAQVLGRQAEVARALRTLESRARGLAVVGAPGSGKSTLARLIARRWIEAHPDGRVVVIDLSDPNRQLHDAVRDLLLSFGVAFDALPAKLDQQTKLLEAVTASNDVVVFDNVARNEAADQAAAYLSDARHVIVSERPGRKRPSLAALPLDLDDSRALLSQHWHTSRVDELLTRCAGNPLALHLAARALAGPEPGDAREPIEFGLALAVQRVRSESGRAREFLVKMLRILADAGGSADPEFASAVWEMDAASAQGYLTAWDEAGVLDLAPSGDLMLRPALAMAVQSATSGDPSNRFLAPLVSHAGQRVGGDGETLPANLAWLDRHWPAVREAVRRFAASPGASPDQPDILDMIAGLRRSAEILNRRHDLLTLDEIAHSVAQRRNDRSAQARALGRLALDHYRRGAIDEADVMATEAVRRARAVGDPILLAGQLVHAAKLALAQRRFEQAVSGLEESVRLARDGGDAALEIDALLTAAECYRHVRNLDDAAGALSRVRHLLAGRPSAGEDPTSWTRLARAYLDLDLPNEAIETLLPLIGGGDGTGPNAPIALELIGESLRQADDADEAATALAGAVEGYRVHGDPAGQCRSLVGLAKLMMEDDPRRAAGYLTQALALAEKSADLPHQVRIRNELGNAQAAIGDVQGALSAFEESINSARELGDLLAVAVALASRGRLLARIGESGRARASLEESRLLFESLDAVADVAAVSRDLADLLIIDGSAGTAIELLERGVATSRDADDLPNELLSLGLLAKAYDIAGQSDDAGQARLRARRLASALGHRSDATEAVLDMVPRELAHGDSEAVDRDLLTLVEQMAAGESGNISSMPLLQLHWRAAVTASRAGDLRRTQRHLGQLIDLARRADRDRPEADAVQRALVTAYRTRANVSAATGEHGAAARDLELALSVARRMGSTRPEDMLEVLGLYRQLGGQAARVGDLRAAENYYRSALDIGNRLIVDAPARADARREIEVVHRLLGDVAVASGNPDHARAEFHEALALASAREGADPEDRREMGYVLRRLGDLARRTGDAVEAISIYQRALAVALLAADADSTNPNAQRDVLIAYLGLGELSSNIGDSQAAVDHFGHSLAIAERLVEAMPGEHLPHRDLAASHRGLGDTYRSISDLPQARRHYMEALAANQRLAAIDPNDVSVARELSFIHDSLGDLYTDLGDLGAAYQHFRESLAISERLAAVEPDNFLLKRDLSISHANVAQALTVGGDRAEARRHVRQALAIARSLSEQDPTNSDYRALVSAFENLGGGV